MHADKLPLDAADDAFVHLPRAGSRRALDRREFLRRGAVLAASLGVGGLAAACGEEDSLSQATEGASPATRSSLLEAAREEGKVVVWHSDQEEDKVEFFRLFTKETGIEVETLGRILPGAALPRLQQELRAGVAEVDVYDTSDPGVMNLLRDDGHLLQYRSPELDAYDDQFKSNPVGYWTAYYLQTNPMMFNSDYVDPAEAPSTWADLLDPRWAGGKIGFQTAAAGSQYAWWYLLKDVLTPDYFDRLAEQEPRPYDSSTQMVVDINSGDLPIGGKVSNFQYAKAKREGIPLEMVNPEEGVPGSISITGIFASSKRPNAARAYTDYLLSEQGQRNWNNVQGSYAPRNGITNEELPPLSDFNVLLPPDYEAYSSEETHEEFIEVWNKVLAV